MRTPLLLSAAYLVMFTSAIRVHVSPATQWCMQQITYSYMHDTSVSPCIVLLPAAVSIVHVGPEPGDCRAAGRTTTQVTPCKNQQILLDLRPPSLDTCHVHRLRAQHVAHVSPIHPTYLTQCTHGSPRTQPFLPTAPIPPLPPTHPVHVSPITAAHQTKP